MNKYLAKIIASDQEGLQMISACSSGAKVKIAVKGPKKYKRIEYIMTKEIP